MLGVFSKLKRQHRLAFGILQQQNVIDEGIGKRFVCVEQIEHCRVVGSDLPFVIYSNHRITHGVDEREQPAVLILSSDDFFG